MNPLTSKLFFTTSTAGQALTKPITTPKNEQDADGDKFVSSMTQGTSLLVADINRDGREVTFGRSAHTDSGYATDDFVNNANKFADLMRLDNSDKDLNPNFRQVEVNVPNEGPGGDREHYLIANYGGKPTQGWMETYESFPANDSMSAFDFRTYTSLDNGRLESSEVTIRPDGSFGVTQYIADMRHPEESSQTSWHSK